MVAPLARQRPKSPRLKQNGIVRDQPSCWMSQVKYFQTLCLKVFEVDIVKKEDRWFAMEQNSQAGLEIADINAEDFPAQCEFQIGIVKAFECYKIWLIRYFLIRVCKRHNTNAVFEPKPINQKRNGSGCHVNISTNTTRSTSAGESMMVNINSYVEKIGPNYK